MGNTGNSGNSVHTIVMGDGRSISELQQKHDGMRRYQGFGPLIKSGRRPMIQTARCCEGFPVYRWKS
jgi:hypothetical protein